MKIEIDVTPKELFNVIYDLKFKDCKSKTLLQKLVEKVDASIEVNTDELTQMQTILYESNNTDKGDKTE